MVLGHGAIGKTLGTTLGAPKTVATGCKVRRDMGRISDDPTRVDCLTCRQSAVVQLLHAAEMALSAAVLPDTTQEDMNLMWDHAVATVRTADRFAVPIGEAFTMALVSA